MFRFRNAVLLAAVALAALLADRPRRVVKVVRLAAGRDLHVRGQQHIALEVDEAELTPRADVHVLVQHRAGLREQRAELHQRRVVAPRERPLQEAEAALLGAAAAGGAAYGLAPKPALYVANPDRST